ncbi:S-layer homology domain-containing protein [Paenibacillus sp. P36]|uniref:S-layer homology domain-containing protein n=1 Tax=Paenibacillus sp. P36 TaxID=3342538 RepID=UPI0038B2F25F
MKRFIRNKKIPAMLLAIATVLNVSSIGALTAHAAPPGEVNVLRSEKVSSGVHFTTEEYSNYYKPNNRVVVNRLDIKPNDPNTKIITAKAYDTISAVETIGDQANREILKGNQVIAGVDGDFYDISGTSGNPLGLMIKDGELIVSQMPGDNDRISFYMDNANKPDIKEIHAEGKFTVTGAVYDVNLLNRNQAVNNALVIHTSKITKTRKMTHNYDADKGKSVFALIRVGNNFDGVHPGQTYTGTVVNVTSTEGFDIPDDSVVLEGVGTSKPIVQALQTNAEVSFKYDLHVGNDAANQDILNNDIVTSITSNAWLVRDGVAVDGGDPVANARTALGMKADGSLIVVTVDKPSSSYSGSVGTGLPDLGKYLQEAGAINALNLDGGGSTEMIARQAGSDRPVTISHPGDVNGSRLVSSSLLFVSTATKGTTVGNVVVDKNVTLYTGSKYDFSYRLADEFGNPISNGNSSASWASTIGSVDPNGHYIANTGIGTGEVSATVDNVKGSAKVSVVDAVATIALTSTNVVLNNNAKKQFGFVATDASGAQVYIDPSVATWSLSGSIGTVSESGLVTSNDSNGTATLTATVAGKTLTTQVTVGIKEQVIDNFEKYPIENYHLGGYAYGNVDQYAGSAGTSPYLSLSTTVKHSGDKSFKMSYDTSKWTNRSLNGTMNLFPHWSSVAQMDATYKTDVYPKRFGMWVYGDGKAPWLRAIFRDGNSSNKTLDLTTETDDINWVGWKYIEVPIPEGWALPIRLNYVYMVETIKSKPAYSGTVYFDDMKFIYTDEVTDVSGPEFTEISPSSDGLFSSTLDFSTTITDSLSGVDENRITVKINDVDYKDYTYDKATGRLSFKLENLTQGDYRVFVDAYDKALTPNESVPYIDKTYHVDLTPDEEAPTMTDVTPTKDVKVKIPTPRVTFKLLDSKSQVDPESISVRMNNIELPVYYDADTGWGYAEPTSDLANGEYALRINARDKAGNAMATYKDQLTLASIPQPQDGDNFKISLIPDTQGNAFTDKLFAKVAADDTSLVMHMGDIVDDGSQLQYDQASDFVNKYFGAADSKPFFVLAGNHEAFQNTLDIYYKKFGSPTMHFNYGNTLIIMLNSAYIQSLTLSDSTQFHWLEEVLKKNTKKNIIVLDHVITRDAFGTKHEMDPKDAAKYESILSNYKLEHPDADIYSIFGHLHSLQTWDVGGVKYIITGNGADKTYLPHSDGDLLGTGKMTVSGGKMAYTFDPLLTKVYITNEAIISGKMNTVIGSQVQMDLFGDFREYPANYLTQINNRKLVGIDWKSSNQDVASVDTNGVVTSKSSGTAIITATSGGKSNSISVETVKPTDVQPVKLELSVPAETEVGDTFIPTIKATNAYGVVYALDAKDVTFSFKNGKAHMQDEGVIIADAEGDEEITATFSGLNATAIAKIIPKPPTPPASGHEDSGNGNLGNSGPIVIAPPTKPNVDLTKDSIVKSGVFAELAKDKNATMTFEGNGYKWKVNGSDITNPNADVDLGVNVKNQAPAGKVSTPVQVNTKKVVMGLSLNQNGALPGKMTLEIPTSQEQAGKKLFFYAVNSADQAPVLVSELTVDENGNVAIPFTTTTAAEYMLTSQKILDFKDADEHWAKSDIYYLTGKDIISGVSDNEFSPNNEITRGEFVKLIAGAAGADVSAYTNSTFADVKSTDWYAPYVAWAEKNKVVNGIDAESFAPNANISREQMAVILIRLTNLVGYKLESNVTPNQFGDEASISSYAVEAVKFAQQAGIINGLPNNQFAPAKSATRAEAAKMLATLLKAMENKK